MTENEQGNGQAPFETAEPVQGKAGAAVQIDPVTELRSMHEGQAWRQGDRAAQTLVKQDDLRIVLLALKAGARLAEHEAPGRLTIQAVQGRFRITAADTQFDLSAGRLLVLEPHLRHEVTAIEEGALLLTIAWPAG